MGPAPGGPATLALDRACLNLIGLLSLNDGFGGTRYFYPVTSRASARRRPWRAAAGKKLEGGFGGTGAQGKGEAGARTGLAAGRRGCSPPVVRLA